MHQSKKILYPGMLSRIFQKMHTNILPRLPPPQTTEVDLFKESVDPVHKTRMNCSSHKAIIDLRGVIKKK